MRVKLGLSLRRALLAVFAAREKKVERRKGFEEQEARANKLFFFL
jgi:hypothetical protein